MRNNDLQPDSTKSEILRVAWNLFMKYGYAKTTYQMIADELSISKATISYHFKGKPWIVFHIFEKYIFAIMDYSRKNPVEEFNLYMLACISQICFYREIMKSERIWALFYHDEHMRIWATECIHVIEGYFNEISRDFHKDLSQEDIRVTAVMCLGAKMSLFKEVTRHLTPIDTEKYCYHIVRLVGILSGLDEHTIQRDIRRAFDFLETRPFPAIDLLGQL
jgi:AcrR family transcriptional regulator